MNCYQNILVILILICSANSFAVEKSVLDKVNGIIDTLTSLTCETQSIGRLLRDQFSHTCVKNDALTMAVAGVSSIGMSLSAMTVTRINDKDLFPNNCEFQNRADYTDPTIDFAFCSNSKLIATHTVGKATSIVTQVIPTIVTNPKETWNKITDLFELPDKKAYHDIKRKTVGDTGLFEDLSIPFKWKIIRYKDQVCLAVLGITGYSPIGCKFIKEPYPKSLYSKFYGETEDARFNLSETDKVLSLTESYNESCYTKALNASKNLIPITAPIVECAKQMVGKMMLGRYAYSFDNSNKTVAQAPKGDSILFKFQQNMRRTVMLLLTIYVIFVGFKILLNGELPKKSELVLYVLKFIFVIYFAIGINKDGEHFDGITKWLFPLIFNATSDFSGWILNASGSELCVFNYDDNPSMGYMAMWDALDCRISHYLGLDILRNALVIETEEYSSMSTAGNFSIPPYFLLIIPAILTNQLWLAQLALFFPIMVILVAAFMVNVFIISLIIIAILAVLAPIFVPMILFDYTKSYFEFWLRLIISFTFQPMIIAVFSMLMFSMFESSLYEGCFYKHKSLDAKDVGRTGGKIHIFSLETDEDQYAGKSEYSFKKCSQSLGYIINTFFKKNKKGANDKSHEEEDDSLNKETRKKSFSDSMKLVWNHGKAITSNLLIGCIMLYLMYMILGNLTGFIADLSNSLDLSGIVINAKEAMKTLHQNSNAIEKKIKSYIAGNKAEAGDGILVKSGEGEGEGVTRQSPVKQEDTQSSSTEESAAGSTTSTATPVLERLQAEPDIEQEPRDRPMAEPVRPNLQIAEISSQATTTQNSEAEKMQSFLKENNISKETVNDESLKDPDSEQTKRYKATLKSAFEKLKADRSEDTDQAQPDLRKNFTNTIENMIDEDNHDLKEKVQKINQEVLDDE